MAKIHETPQMQNEIENLLSNLLVYINPEYFSPSFINELRKGSNFNRSIVERYWKLLTSIDWFVKKISKYPLYFNEFYAGNKKISNHEALEYHIFAYLEDIAL